LRKINFNLALKELNFKTPLLYSLLIDLFFVPGIYFIFKSNSNDPVNQNKNEKIIRGSTIESVKKYKKAIDANEIFSYLNDLPLTMKVIYRNILVLGATGSGKTQIICKILSDSYEKFDYNAVIYDSKKDFVPKFYNSKYDIIFNPADARCPAWNILGEIENKADAATLAEVLIPEPESGNPNGYFITNARHILEAMILYLKMKNIGTNENLIDLASKTPDYLLQLFKSDPKIEKECKLAINPLQSDEIKSMMTEISRYLKAFTIMPSMPDKEGMKSFNITPDFLKKRKTRIFLNLDKNSEIFVKPIMKIFIELLLKKFLSVPDGENTPTLFLLDELSNFEKTPSVMDLLDKGRSKMASTIIGIQDKAKSEFIYGEKLTENMMNSCNSSIYLRVNSSAEAEYVSRQIGSQEVERTSASDSVTDDKYTHSKSSQIIEKKLFLPSEILKWQDLEAVIKLVNIPYFLHISILPRAYTVIAEGLIPSDRLNISVVKDEKQKIVRQIKDEPAPASREEKKEQAEKLTDVERKFTRLM
jgi:type IV secretory pathway TraG/TraD family ATPase VirD4